MNRWRWCCMLFVTLLMAGAEACAAATGAELVRTCKRALVAGYTGFEAGICDWYVVPCPVCGAEPAPPTACPPADIEHATLARVVVDALTVRTDAANLPAPVLVTQILQAAYPCTTSPTATSGSR